MAGLVNLDVGSALGGLFSLVDELFTSDDERAQARFRVLQLHAQGKLAQIGVNSEEAKHKSLFVAGWRPFIGWICGIALAWNCLFVPMLHFGAWFLGEYFLITMDTAKLPVMGTELLTMVLTGMLGFGAMRTVEKINKVNSDRMQT